MPDVFDELRDAFTKARKSKTYRDAAAEMHLEQQAWDREMEAAQAKEAEEE